MNAYSEENLAGQILNAAPNVPGVMTRKIDIIKEHKFLLTPYHLCTNIIKSTLTAKRQNLEICGLGGHLKLGIVFKCICFLGDWCKVVFSPDKSPKNWKLTLLEELKLMGPLFAKLLFLGF